MAAMFASFSFAQPPLTRHSSSSNTDDSISPSASRSPSPFSSHRRPLSHHHQQTSSITEISHQLANQHLHAIPTPTPSYPPEYLASTTPSYHDPFTSPPSSRPTSRRPSICLPHTSSFTNQAVAASQFSQPASTFDANIRARRRSASRQQCHPTRLSQISALVAHLLREQGDGRIYSSTHPSSHVVRQNAVVRDGGRPPTSSPPISCSPTAGFGGGTVGMAGLGEGRRNSGIGMGGGGRAVTFSSNNHPSDGEDEGMLDQDDGSSSSSSCSSPGEMYLSRATTPARQIAGSSPTTNTAPVLATGGTTVTRSGARGKVEKRSSMVAPRRRKVVG